MALLKEVRCECGNLIGIDEGKWVKMKICSICEKLIRYIKLTDETEMTHLICAISVNGRCGSPQGVFISCSEWGMRDAQIAIVAWKYREFK